MKFPVVLLVFLWMLGTSSLAFPFPQPPALIPEILSEPIPSAIPPLKIVTEDYTFRWIGEKIPDIEISLGKGSIQWVRVFDILVLPRALLTVNAKGVVSGNVFYAGFSHPMAVSEGVGRVTVPLALISGEHNAVHITLLRENREIRGQIELRYRPQHQKAEIAIDTSCSSFGVNAESVHLSTDQWLYLGCRFIHLQGEGHRILSLELYLFWDNVGQSMKINGVGTPSAQVSLWTLKLGASRTPLLLQAGKQEEESVTVRYVVPERTRLAFLGAGIGPYSYRYIAPGIDVNTVAPILTFYGSYLLGETVRLVMFDATSLRSPLYTDLGVYLNYEVAKILDRRITINILLGGHVIAFDANDQVNFTVSAPQGVEFVYRDFYKKQYSLSGGGFILPEINGKAYQNVWLRWGTAKLFVEFNFIGWTEKLGNDRVEMRSYGISIGGPLARFF